MKILKKIILTILIILIISSFGGYIYFDRKFTPDKNYLTIENESGLIPFKWLGTEKNVLLLPIHFVGDSTTFYLQFDTGSPYTIFYVKSIQNISQISINKEVVKTSFYIGKTKISSDKFKIYNNENVKDNDSLKIIGTIGTDILENRKTLINFKENYIVLNLLNAPKQFQTKLLDFEFKKRKIIFNASLRGKEENFLYDSGSSAYELLTNKKVWKNLKTPNSKIKIEKVKSWDKILTAYTANCKHKIQFSNQKIPLNHVTHIEGFSQVQYVMMKFSGMTGMIGNKIFLKNCLYLDCKQNKMGIE